jgi:hypothetical protein
MKDVFFDGFCCCLALVAAVLFAMNDGGLFSVVMMIAAAVGFWILGRVDARRSLADIRDRADESHTSY